MRRTVAAGGEGWDAMREHLLRRAGHAGTDDEIAERIMAVAPKAAVRAVAIAEDHPCSAPPGSAAWRQNRAKVTSIVVGCIARIGRLAIILPDAWAVPCEPDDESV